LKLFPHAGGWGRTSWRQFRAIFDYGKDLFLVGVGTQLIMTSQTIVITRMLGLEAAAMWGVGLRVFNLLNQLIWRISDMSGSAIAEMLARGEIARLRERYQTICVLSFSLSAALAVSFALCNSLFITLWTHGKIHWPAENDFLLGIWMIVSAAVHCHNCFVLMTKKVRLMRYLYFVEGSVFVTLSFLVARWGGLPAIIGCSIVCSTLFSGAYGIWRISRFFEISFREVAFDWLRPMGKVLLFYLPIAALTWWLLASASELTQLASHTLLAGSLGTYFFLRFGVPPAFQIELLRRVPSWAAFWLKRFFLQPAN
jgi:O-antigen/teichoic acid export membrane protein